MVKIPLIGDEKNKENGSSTHEVVDTAVGQIVNASGHRDQLQREYGFWGVCGLALNVDVAWLAIGVTLAVALRE